MHVLYVIDSLARGGAEQSLAAIAPHYADRGVQLTVGYLAERDGVRGELEAGGARVRSFAGPGGRSGAFRRVLGGVRDLRPDLVHTTLFEADLAGRAAARLAGVPVVSSLVNEAYGPDQAGDHRVRRWKLQTARLADAASARAVQRFHAVSHRVAEVMSRRLAVPRDRVEVIHRGRDLRRLGERTPARRAAARLALGLADDTPVLLAAARQEHQKGLDILLQALPLVLRRFPETMLLLAGRDGGGTAALRARAARPDLAGAVRFLGPRDDVPDLLCAADALVIPTRWEGLPGVLLEAMALGTPVVATRLPAICEAAGDAHALLVPPERPAALAHAVAAVLADPGAADGRARRARDRFLAEFSIDRAADHMVAFYRRALA